MKRNKPFVEKAEHKYPGLYTYEKTAYVNSKKPVVITCVKHGDFLATPSVFLNRGTGCSSCSKERKSSKLKMSKQDFLNKAKEVHAGRYDYIEDSYSKVTGKVKILCRDHGVFVQTGNDHLAGKGCPLCGNARIAEKRTKSYEEFLADARKIHSNKYSYPTPAPVNFSRKEKVNIVCDKHGLFEQVAFDHLAGKGCAKCKADSTASAQKYSFEEYTNKVSVRHNNRYTYLKDGFTSASHGYIKLVCQHHGEVTLTAENHMTGSNCPACNSKLSKPEKELRKLLKNHFTFSNRSIIAPLELDLLSKDKSLAIEFNGLYWHREEVKGKTYHKDKTNKCKEKGIRLIHIREDIWHTKESQIKDYLLSLITASKKVFARKTVCKPINEDVCKGFLNKYHIQGYSKASRSFGLFLDNKLISVASFSDARGYLFKHEDNQFELVRLCSLPFYSVTGGLSKMITALRRVENVSSIKSYCDLDLFTGKVYTDSGFQLEGVSENYVYFKGLKVKSRYSMQKHKLPKVLETFDASLSGPANCAKNGWHRYYGVGTATYVKRF